MSRYVDGFVLPVPRANIEAYRQLAIDTTERWCNAFSFVDMDSNFHVAID